MMKIGRLLSFILVTCIAGNAFAQHRSLRGKILDARTLEPLPYANIFINYTTIGTNANDRGEFILDHIPAGDQEIVCSYVGHQTHQLTFTRKDSVQSIEIKLLPVELKAVEIADTKDEKWNKNLKKFETLFLGEGRSSNCKIVNPWVMDFAEGRDELFTAEASAPIEIENLYLGYKIWYQLRNFIVNSVAYNISGHIRFEEIQATDRKTALRWTKNRSEAYKGSPRHLLKAIIDNRIEEEGFQVYTDLSAPGPLVRSSNFGEEINKKVIPFKRENNISFDRLSGVYTISLPKRIEVHYLNKTSSDILYKDIPYAVSWIEMLGPAVECNSQGVILNPAKMLVRGYMWRSRVASILPHDYLPDQEVSFENSSQVPK